MESPNSEFQQQSFQSMNSEVDKLSDQYRSMRELLKVYGVNVGDGTTSPVGGNSIVKREISVEPIKSHLQSTAPMSPVHPSELLRSAFTDQLNTHWLELCRNSARINTTNSINSLPSASSFSSVGRTREESPSSLLPENTLTRFESAAECEEVDCILQQLRDHYHCEDRYCVRDTSDDSAAAPHRGRRYLKTFNKKEEIVRHLKWHKKRAETLKFGFLRFSCMDDCKLNGFDAGCQFNGKQTHYHCVEPDCDKVYISTSDVQMHANYHRKTNAIKLQGFLRVRNLEMCQEPDCPYAHQQTTHFHCLRDGCQFTFKNKGEMEKHKVYHMKDEQLLSDGFKKFFKADKCKFQNCRYDSKLNHIHCIRPNCSYVFHSSGQLMSHKRKHEKNELARGDASASNLSDDGEMSSVSADNSLLDLSLGAGVVGLGSVLTPPNRNGSSSGLSSQHQLVSLNVAPSAPQVSAENYLGGAAMPQPPSGPPVNNNILQITSIDGLFNRKRGRPPKNRFVEVYNSNHARTSYSPQDQLHRNRSTSSADSPQAIFASFKLDKSVTGGMNGEAEGSRESPKKKPRFVEQAAAVASVRNADMRPAGLIKSNGIYFPNAAVNPTTTIPSVVATDCESRSSDSNGSPRGSRGVGVGNGAMRHDLNERDADNEAEDEEEIVTATTTTSDDNEDAFCADEHDNGNGKLNHLLNPFTGKHLPNQHVSSGALADNTVPFVPTTFPVNMAAMELNNRDANGMPNFGIEWLKYAYQQANPLMVFATTAALLAASMNPIEQPQLPATAAASIGMDPGLLEYAKNMFLYNNIQQQLAAAATATTETSNNIKTGGLSMTNGHLASGNSQDLSLPPTSNLSIDSTTIDYSKGGSISNFSKDEAIPSGYLKFRFNEDCQFTTCGYRNHQSHFHCLRENCFYSFCDKTRFVQHTARHERLDKLMGSDFKQFRSNMSCGYEGCEFALQQNNRLADEDDANASGSGAAKGRNASKSSHFHCQKCDYICTDTNKVVAHRRQHNKTDFIRLSGFRKVASSEPCYNQGTQSSASTSTTTTVAASPQENTLSGSAVVVVGTNELGPAKCHYSGKQTHYHCLVCNSVVLNRSQLTVHRHKGQTK